MYERDCQEVFGHQLEHDPLGQQLEESRLKQTQQQICDYFGMVDRLVWSAAKPAALSESRDPSDTAAIMDQWLDHINEEVELRKGLLAENVHVMVASQHTNTAVTHTGLENALSFFHHSDSPTKAAELAEEYRKYLALVSIGLSPVPSKKVDDAWHAHILNTKKYQADTRALLGHFLHHEPANLLLEQ